MCPKRTSATGFRTIAAQSSGTNTPCASICVPTGTCIQLLLTMIQNAESVVASATHRAREQIEPGRDALPPEEQHAEESRLERERGEGLVGEERALDGTGAPRELAPVGAELERHHDAGDDAEPEGDREDAQPQVEQSPVDRLPGALVQDLEQREPRREPMVNAGKMIWNEIVNANWMRESSSASESGFMGGARLVSRVLDWAPLPFRKGLADRFT